MKIFCSGSCRLLTSINNGRGKVNPIHSMFFNFIGKNFLGKLHNTKQHIQFINFIKDEIVIPDYILPSFLTAFNEPFLKKIPKFKYEKSSQLATNKLKIKNQFNECDWYIFEICSLKYYQKDGFQVQMELTKDYDFFVQTQEDLMNDLKRIRELIPLEKKILFQVHFRPNIIYDDPTKSMSKRETIYETVHQFSLENENVYIYDPSKFIKENLNYIHDIEHFTPRGHLENFHWIYKNYLSL
jgi:hypothetical protein